MRGVGLHLFIVSSEAAMMMFLLFLLSCPDASAVVHSLWHIHTASSEVPHLPDTVAVVLVDGLQTDYYDSDTRRTVPTQAWMNRVMEDDPEYWKKQDAFWEFQMEAARRNMRFYKERFNQTGGIHVLQVLHGCEWNSETGEVRGFDVVSYDGDDVMVLDVKAKRWIAIKPQAIPTQQRYNNDEVWLEFMDHRLLQECPERLRRSWEYGRSFLQRTELPAVSLLQKTPWSPVSCHATGFYPDTAAMFWRRDGEEIHEQVDRGELLSNHDGTFQMSVDLNISLLRAEDWRRYDCVFKLLGVQEDVVTELDRAAIRTNWVESTSTSLPIVLVAVFALFVVLIAATGVAVYRKKRVQPPSQPPENVEISQRLRPEP